MGRLPRLLPELPVVRGATLALICACLAGAASGAACAGPPAAAPPALASDGRYLMGTVLEVTLCGGAEDLEAVFALVAELEGIVSTWDARSDASRLNRAAGSGPVPIDPALHALLADAVRYGRLTRGAFDVTVGPLVALWREAEARGVLPDPAALRAARARVGVADLALGAGSATLPRPGMAVDLGGIAKGWALDRVAERLRARGVPCALASFGRSSTLALGAPPDAPAWRLLLQVGDRPGVVALRDASLSVSGAGEPLEIAGMRYGHVIDPRSGRPVVASREAAVVAEGGALAEALSTALLVLAPEEGLDLVESLPGVEALLVLPEGEVRRTTGWEG